MNSPLAIGTKSLKIGLFCFGLFLIYLYLFCFFTLPIIHSNITNVNITNIEGKLITKNHDCKSYSYEEK